MVATFVIHVITWITTHLSSPEEWKAKLKPFTRQNFEQRPADVYIFANNSGVYKFELKQTNWKPICQIIIAMLMTIGQSRVHYQTNFVIYFCNF